MAGPKIKELLALSREAARLGLSSVDQLNTLQIERFATWDVFLDVERIFAGLETWEARSIEQYFTGGRKLLVGCVGAGRELAALDKLGFDVDAFDCCAGLVAHGNRALSERGVAKRITLSRPDAVPAELAGPYDGAIVGSGGYMHLVGRARRVAFLQQLRARLRPGAPILLSFFFRRQEPEFQTVASLASALRLARGRRDPVEVGDRWWQGTYCHYFTYDEVGLELALGGFDLEQFELAPRPYAVGRALNVST